ncbi:MAG: hypothetical protein KCHDKBKB_00812 [Elusimicrobia bacterium]|nr:hypothetical protein [Elusimicrobiota bacterium]
METQSIRCYEKHMFLRFLLRQIFLFTVIYVSGLGFLFAGQPAFLIFNEGIEISQEANRLEMSGFKIRAQIPPRILIVDVPDLSKASALTGAQSIYSSVIPLSVLEPMGNVAVAAGIQWNRKQVKATKAFGKNMGAMRVLMAQKSLPAPQNLQLISKESNGIQLTWQAVDGALYYEVEASFDEAFTQKFCFTRAPSPQALLPTFEGSDNRNIFVRVRGVDSIPTDEKEPETIYGNWGRGGPLQINGKTAEPNLTAPTLTSPIPNFLSEGFTLILEWSALGDQPSRVQVSKSRDFSSPVYDTFASVAEYAIPSPGFREGEELFWRVKTWGPQSSGWSEIRKIKIGSPRHKETDMMVNPEAPR